MKETRQPENPEDLQREDARPSKEDLNTWASLCHFSALLGIIWWMPVGPIWLPFGHLLAPATVWLLKRGLSPSINEAGKESLNFQLSMTAYGILCAVFLRSWMPFPLVHLFVLADSVLAVTAGVRASNGQSYRYPLTLLRVLR